MVVDAGRSHVRPAATWFASPIVEQAIGPGLEHPYDHALPGLVETTLERGRPLFLASRRATGRRRRGCASGSSATAAGSERTAEVWDAYAQASVIVCPVRTPLGRALGVLGVASLDPPGRSPAPTWTRWT